MSAPHILIQPRDPNRAVFLICGSAEFENAVPAWTILHLDRAMVAEWLCPKCARRYTSPRPPHFVPADVKPAEPVQARRRRSRKDRARRRAFREAMTS